jgi:thiol-disulfide isomerase/thioredoxin
MKTRFTLIAFVLTFAMSLGLLAQTNYYILSSVGASADYNFQTTGTFVMNGTTSGLPDTLSPALTIPFPFKFYGKDYTKYKISDNGYITFDITQTASIPTNTALPNAAAPKNSIFAFWDALMLTKPDATYRYAILNWTYGSAPNRVHVIQWFQNHKDASTTSSYTFAIRLYENGKFDVVYNFYFAGSSPSYSLSATLGCQNEDGTIGYSYTDSPNRVFPTSLTTGANATFEVYDFIYGVQPEYDLTVTALNIKPFVQTGTSVSVAGNIRNIGSKPITSMKLNYSVDGGAPVSQTINSINITTGSTYAFTHPTNWTVPATEKEYTIEVWATELNGNADGNTANDKLSSKTTAIQTLVPRKPLYEVFTSSTCPPCKPGNEKLDQVFAQYPDKWTCVKYQYYFPGTGDPYTTTEGIARGTFYGGINSVPRLEVDGGWNGNPGGYTNAIFDQFYSAPCFVTIKADANISGQKVTVTGNVTSNATISGTVKLYIAVVEKKSTKNVKSNGETEFHYVMKKMIPDANGVTVTPVKGTPIPINQTYTFPGNYRLPANGQTANLINLATEHIVEEFTDLTVVVWLQSSATKEVFQSEFATTVNAVEEETSNFMVNLYPNPVSTTGQIRFNLENPTLVSFEVVNSIGQKVFSNIPSTLTAGTQVLDFDASTLLSGVYYMNLYLGNEVITRKFVK